MKYITIVICCILIGLSVFPATAAEEKPKSFRETISGLQKLDGFFPIYWDAKAGKLWMEISKFDQEFLYLTSLPGGVGSNDIGLDRGQIGDTRVVKFYRSGARVLLIHVNYGFRALTNDATERRTVEDSFAQSVLWGFEVKAEESGRVLVDATPFFLNDYHNIAATLKETKQGEFKLDSSRCAIYLPNTKAFPRNTEVEALLTFIGDSPGDYVKEVVPTPTAITVREHHSFIQAPDANYTPRVFDPRAGFYFITFKDYSSPVGEPLIKQWIARHRLQKTNPSAALSEPVEPIVYYMDPGAPEPMRSALMEGASWWNQAFEAAGYKNAFQVKLLPKDADPMDVRYNVIQWVHRSTRGWSYGNTVYDPRTGEILKGHVTLGSQRVRQDYLIAEGLLAPYEKGRGVSREMEKMALARLRQLAAHEVGHTIGLSHNYYASTNERASVMDYPPPVVSINDAGDLDLADAYATGIGEWDKLAIRYGYSHFAKVEEERRHLSNILNESLNRGVLFITDEDARPVGSAHPRAHLWDNGTAAVEELQHIMKVRRIALDRFSENNIREGRPLATLEEVLVPIYMFHRYQVQAVSKLIGGLNYTYAIRGDNQTATSAIAPRQQRAALRALLKTIHPGELTVSDKLLALIPPRPFGHPRWRELFNNHTGVAFDPLAPAESAANLTLSMLLNEERAARLIEHHSRDRDQLGFVEVIDALLHQTWKAPLTKGYAAEIQRVVNTVALYHMMSLVASESATEQTRAIVWSRLQILRNWLLARARSSVDTDWRDHYAFAAAQIKRYEEHPKEIPLRKPIEPPPGPPIGCE